MGRLFTRTCMAFFWTGIIFLLLFIPSISRFFYQEKSVSLFIWPMILDPKTLEQFEVDTGIKVYVNYYESNEELYSKLQATGGKGYDIIVPTDYMVEQLIKDGLIKKIDTSQLTFMHRIKPSLLGNYYDPTNEYSIPYYMTIFGLGVNKAYFNGEPLRSWGLAFNKDLVESPICMIDSTREAILLAAYYLYGTIDSAGTPEHLAAITHLLRDQKGWVEVYTSARIEELLASGSCAVAVGTSTDIWKATREYPNIEFVVPDEGSFVTIDSFALSKATDKDTLAYQLINYLYSASVVRHNSMKHGFCSPVTDVAVEGRGIYCPTHEEYRKLHFFKNVLTREQMQDLWISVKAD